MDVPVPEDTDSISADMIEREAQTIETRILACKAHLVKTRQFQYTDTIISCLEDALFDLEIKIDSAGGAWERLLHKAVNVAAEHVLERKAEAQRYCLASQVAPPTPAPNHPDPGENLSLVFERCIEDLNQGKWRENKSERDARLTAERILTLIGDKPINLFTRRDAAEFKRLLKYPC